MEEIDIRKKHMFLLPTFIYFESIHFNSKINPKQSPNSSHSPCAHILKKIELNFPINNIPDFCNK